jgi:hypothetical protein
MNRSRVTQGIRTGTFGEFVILGSQYEDRGGELNWCVAVVAGQDSTIRVRHIIAGELPEALRSDEWDAVVQAIELWESQSTTQKGQTKLLTS